MKYINTLLLSCLLSSAFAATAPFDLTITGDQMEVKKSLQLSDVGEGTPKSILTSKIR